ncbi:MAG: hypothetical protein KA003_21835, partial [Caldilineaceae bacterium]|nr:hypothetical protein [Caldilineaceae bacterium]
MSWAIPEWAGSSCVHAVVLAHSGIGGEISSIPGMGQNYLLYLRSSGPFPECSVFERKTLSLMPMGHGPGSIAPFPDLFAPSFIGQRGDSLDCPAVICQFHCRGPVRLG